MLLFVFVEKSMLHCLRPLKTAHPDIKCSLSSSNVTIVIHCEIGDFDSRKMNETSSLVPRADVKDND